MTVQWQEPYGSREQPKKHNRWEEFTRELRAHPGRWALARNTGSRKDLAMTLAWTLKRERNLETDVRISGDGDWLVFARAPEVQS